MIEGRRRRRGGGEGEVGGRWSEGGGETEGHMEGEAGGDRGGRWRGETDKPVFNIEFDLFGCKAAILVSIPLSSCRSIDPSPFASYK